MPPISFIGTEVLTYLFFVAALIHASRAGRAAVGYLLGATLFGLMLEYVNVNGLANYSYGQFLVMLGPIPVCIGCGWGIIIYAARLLSDEVGLPPWTRPALDALLALNIDLSMDIVAYRLGMWNWGWAARGNPNIWTAEWFGVPYGNFFGWLMVVALYSAFARALERRPPARAGLRPAWEIGAPFLAVFLSEAVLVAILRFPYQFDNGYLIAWIAVAGVCAAITGNGLAHRQPTGQSFHPLTWAVPAFYHGYFLLWLLIGAYYRENPLILIISLLNVAAALAIHAGPRLLRRGAALPLPAPTPR